MNELNEEIKKTLNLMQTDIDDGAHNELQYHLMSLLEMKRNELQQRLVERSWAGPVTHGQAPYKSGQIADVAKPLTTEELDFTRVFFNVRGNKQIHRIGNEFYWSEE